MARKQSKKAHLARKSKPVQEVSTSARAEELPKPRVELTSAPDKHRRASVLIAGGDEALPNTKSIDDAISSTARMSASFTDDNILRKSLESEGEKVKPEGEELEDKTEKKLSDSGETIEPNQFEDAIKESKLDFMENHSGHIIRNDSDISPTTTKTNDVKLALDEIAIKDQSKKGVEESAAIDPITLIGDKRKSELQEYIPEQKTANEEIKEFEPTQEELASTENEDKHSEMKNEHLPWTSEALEDENLQRETDNPRPNKGKEELLPWEVEDTDSIANLQRETDNPRPNKGKEELLPWEVEEADSPNGSTHEDKLPWEAEEYTHSLSKHNDNLPRETEKLKLKNFMDDPKQSSNDTNVDDLFQESHDVEFLSKTVKDKEEKDQSQVLNYSVNLNSSNKSLQTSSQDPEIHATNQSAYLKNENKTALEDLTAANINKSKSDLDNLFQEDDDDTFLHELKESDNSNIDFKFPSSSGANSNKESKLQDKSLDFLDLDDDLLDDDFLEDDNNNDGQEHISNLSNDSKTHNKSYVPTLAHSLPVSSGAESSKESGASKKKNDAYDFPDNLLAKSFKPAARSSKYAPNAKPSPDPKLPSKQSVDSPSQQGQVLHSTSASQGLIPSVSSQVPQIKKSFFEDLPMPIQKQTVKPARAALPRPQVYPNASPIVNPAQPQLQKPVVNPYAKPAMNTAISPTMNYTQPAGVPSSSNYTRGSQVPPVGLTTQSFPPPPSQFTNNASIPQIQPQPFPNMQNPALGQNSNVNVPTRKISNPTPNPINTALPKVQGTQNSNSPYVPNAGPYAPSSHKRTLSRASSLIGAKSKEINPYAPAPGNISNTQPSPIGLVNQGLMPKIASPTAPTTAINNAIHGRRRGASNVKSNFYHKEQAAPKVENPNALLQRQFPIFNWSSSKNVTYLVPSGVTNTYGNAPEMINVSDVKDILKNSHYLSSFPGPLNKLKTKKKDVEKWLETYNEYLSQNVRNQEELMLSQILLSLVRHNGDFKSKEFAKEACAVLNPSIDYNNVNSSMDIGNSMSVLANAYKLDNAGINVVWSFLQAGNTEKALEFCLSKSDWALALMIASFDGPEKFGKIAADYARSSFPYQKSQSKVHHLMPIMLKLFAGNFKSAIDDIMNVQSEGEWSVQHWRDLVSLVVINNPQNGNEFLCEFSKALAVSGHIIESQICLILTGFPLSNIPSQHNGIAFSLIGFGSHSFVYSEIYEYALQLGASNIPPTGFVHLLPFKLKHAQVLADYGFFVESQKYCDTISTTIKATGRSSFFFLNPVAFEEFQNLLMRISHSGSSELGWFGSKKLNLDKMWDQLDKFIGGDESKSKSGENGVFSKFSPSVSRAPSSLDITAIHNNYPLTLPHVRADHIRDNLVSTNSAPATSSDNAILKLTAMAHNRPPPSLYSNSSTTSILKYAPPSTQILSKSTAARSEQHNFSPQQASNPAFESLQQSRMIPNTNSAHNLPFNQNQHENVNQVGKVQPKASMSSLKMYSANNSSFPYMNSSAQLSSLSIASHQSLHMAMSVPNPTHAISARPSIANSFSENQVNTNQISNHKHTSSLQSDISMDYPTEFKSAQKSLNEITVPENATNKHFKRESEQIPETISESKEMGELTGKNTDSDAVQIDTHSGNENEDFANLENLVQSPPAPPSKGVSKPLTSTPSVPRKARTRVNPYAPSAATSKSNNNKYSSLTSNKYASTKKEGVNLLVETPSDISYNDIFNYGGFQPPQEIKVDESKDTETDSSQLENKLEPKKISDVVSQPEPITQFPPTSRYTNANVDDSFENENLNENAIETSSIHTPNPRTPFSNKIDSLRSNGRESMFHPYQENDTKERRISNFGVDSSFGEFPIPGSPDLTTRANSVIGGQGGLFSSRLSQSQQSALYQQYEVQDDTVKDYIPVVDEEEEDSEDESLKREKKKKEEQESQKRIKEDRARQDAAASQRNQKRWFSNLLGNRNDDKPKPIRAKMGEKNAFVYDEKLKRWINKDIPLEEQLKSSAPPPPPASKKKPVDSSTTSFNAPGVGVKLETGPSATLTSNGASLKAPKKSSGSQPPVGPPPSVGASLANAGLDDLLSLGGGSSTGRKAKKGPRRGYVNLLDQK